MILVIGEKPSVSREIAKVLGAKSKQSGYLEGGGYIVSWCYGHLVGLKLPDEYSKNWAGKWTFEQLPMIPKKWEFHIAEGCNAQFRVLRTLMAKDSVTEIICATDADREGECIFRYVYNLCDCQKPVKRLWISSLEEKAILEGMAQLKSMSEYDNLYQAGLCRAKADWLVGMNGSRLFSVRYNAQLNTGRVQTPTLAMIVNRDGEIDGFRKQKYFTVDLDCGCKASSERIDDEETAKHLAADCDGKSARVTEIHSEVKTIAPPKPFDLTTLQREANRKFGYTAQQTLEYVQSLYEKKLLTYPRTDSQYLPEDMEESTYALLPSLIEKFQIKDEFTPNLKAVINGKKVSGHHALIPTESGVKKDFNSLPTGEGNILRLVSNRLICSSAPPHKYKTFKVTFTCQGKEFTSTGRTILEMGWKLIDDSLLEEKEIPDLTEGAEIQAKSSLSEHFTTPPKAFSEDTLLSAMEHASAEEFAKETDKKGLGTPATRASVIENLVRHGYVKRDGKKIVATDKGKSLASVLPDEVKSPTLTADWENRLLEVEQGKLSAEEFMHDIEDFIRKLCATYGAEDESMLFTHTQSLGDCPKCHKPVVKGKYGWYCSGRCGMNVAKVYGTELSESQIKSLLNNSSISYSYNGRTTIVLPEVTVNEYNGKLYHNWKTRKG